MRLRQEAAEVKTAWSRLLAAGAAAERRGLGDAMRAADQQAMAVVEANLPKGAMDSDTLRSARVASEEVTRGALLALVLRGSIDAGSFATLFSPFAGVAPL